MGNGFHIFDSDPPIEGGMYGDLINAALAIFDPLHISFNSKIGTEEHTNEIRSAALSIKTIREYARRKFDALSPEMKQEKIFEDEIASYVQSLDANRVERFDGIVEEIRKAAIVEVIDVTLLRALAGEIFTLVKTKKDGQHAKIMSRLGLPYEDPIYSSANSSL